MIEKQVPHAVLMVMFDQEKKQFLLSNRPDGTILIPSEKGAGDIRKTALRGIKEEMGEHILNPEITILPLSFPYIIGDLGEGIVDMVLVTHWEGEIINVEDGKDNFFWVDLDRVVQSLTLDVSKMVLLAALFELVNQEMIEKEELVNQLAQAPELKTDS